jgi:hypothetical protein
MGTFIISWIDWGLHEIASSRQFIQNEQSKLSHAIKILKELMDGRTTFQGGW